MASRRPLSKATRRRIRRRAITVASWVGSAFIILGVTAGVTHLSGWTINTVTIKGAEKVSVSAVRERVTDTLSGRHLFLFARDNRFLYPNGDIRRDIRSAFPRIRSVSFSFPRMTALTVRVQEREPYARLCPNDHSSSDTATSTDPKTPCHVLDKNGVAFTTAASSAATSTIEVVDERATSTAIGDVYRPSVFPAFSNFLSSLASNDLEATGITAEGERDYRIALKRGGQLLVRSDSDLGTVRQNLLLLLTHNELPLDAGSDTNSFSSIDLRYGNRIFYELRGTSTATNTVPNIRRSTSTTDS